jgi:Spy/CpxP family protein refolding chaperone
MQSSFLKHAVLAFSAPLVAQRPSATRHPDAARWLSFDRYLEHLARVLGLTESQKEQAITIFRNARKSSQPVHQELRQNRELLTAAAKSASELDIQRLATEQGRLFGQLVAIRARASAKFYQTLTPEQRVKYDQMREQSRQKVYSGERENRS